MIFLRCAYTKVKVTFVINLFIFIVDRYFYIKVRVRYPIHKILSMFSLSICWDLGSLISMVTIILLIIICTGHHVSKTTKKKTFYFSGKYSLTNPSKHMR
jgi:hypothetical protein